MIFLHFTTNYETIKIEMHCKYKILESTTYFREEYNSFCHFMQDYNYRQRQSFSIYPIDK